LGDDDARILSAIIADYRALLERERDASPLACGQELAAWLDRDGWLTQALSANFGVFRLEIAGPKAPSGRFETLVLDAPWEVLADGSGFLADAAGGFAVWRRLDHASADLKPVGHDYRLGVVFMAAGVDLNLDIELEETRIIEAVDSNIDLWIEDTGEAAGLKRLLSDLRKLQPQVAHISCHGTLRNGRPCLMLEDEAGGERAVDAAELAGCFDADAPPRLVVLSACGSAADGLGAAGLAPLATDLLKASVPAVLGWSGTVNDGAAIAFAGHFYRELGQGMDVAAAVGLARRALKSGGATPERDAAREARAASSDVHARDWHRARLWLGPDGGGRLVEGGAERIKIAPNSHFGVLADARSRAGRDRVIASPDFFVGRRPDSKRLWRALTARPATHAGALIWGQGQRGKTSLAARLMNLHRDRFAMAVVIAPFRRLAVLEAIKAATNLPEGAAKAVEAALANLNAMGDRPDRELAPMLEAALTSLLKAELSGQDEARRPLLLLLDDFEAMLPKEGEAAIPAVLPAHRDAAAAVLAAFAAARHESRSRLLITCRSKFTLNRDGRDLGAVLHDHQLEPLSDNDRRKLEMRERDLWTSRRREPLSAWRGKALGRATAIARGHAGLQDRLSSKLALAPGLGQVEVEAGLGEMEDHLAGRPDLATSPHTSELVDYLQVIAIDKLLKAAREAHQEPLLRAATLFQLPVPGAVLEALSSEVYGGDWMLLRDLKLLDSVPTRPPGSEAETFWLRADPLAAAALAPLAEDERADLAKAALPTLFAAWGGTPGRMERPATADVELTHLALEAGDAGVAAACAADAVRWLERSGQPRAAADLGLAAIALVETDPPAKPPPMLLVLTARCLFTAGEGEAAGAVYEKAASRVKEPGGGLEPDDHLALLHAHGHYLLDSGRLDEALAAFTQRAELSEALGKDRERAIARGGIADILYHRGDLDEALRIRREEQLPVYAGLGDVRSIAGTQGQIADILFKRGDLDEALRIRREEQLPVFVGLGAVREIAIAKSQIADILFQRGDWDEALRIRREEELPIFARLGAVRDIAITQGKIADTLFRRGDLDEALRIRRADQLPVFARLGDVREIAITQCKIAEILFRRGDLDEALRTLRTEALPVFARLGDVREIAVTQGLIADILHRRRDLDEALRIRREEQLPAYLRLGDLDGIASAHWGIATIALAKREWGLAATHLAESWSLNKRLGRRDALAIVGAMHGQMLAVSGDREGGLAVLREARESARFLGMDEKVREIDELLSQVMAMGEEPQAAPRPREEPGRRRRPGSVLGALGRLFSRSGGAG
jgi:tetratricopeptide (TPR) repeat protein